MFSKFFIIALVFSLQSYAKFPPDIQQCSAGDTDCIVKMANDFVRKYANGRDDIAFTGYDPYIASNLSLADHSSGPLNIQLFLKRAETHGLSKMNFLKAVGFTKDPNTSKFELYGNLPKLELKGDYRAKGMILLLPIQGDGSYSIIVEDNKIAYKFKTTVVERNGLHYIQIKKVKILIEPKRATFKLTNLFNGNKELGDTINHVLNENWKDAWKELSPAIIEANQNILQQTLQRFFDKNEYDNFYLPE